MTDCMNYARISCSLQIFWFRLSPVFSVTNKIAYRLYAAYIICFVGKNDAKDGLAVERISCI